MFLFFFSPSTVLLHRQQNFYWCYNNLTFTLPTSFEIFHHLLSNIKDMKIKSIKHTYMVWRLYYIEWDFVPFNSMIRDSLKSLFWISLRREFSRRNYNLSSINTHQIALISRRYNYVSVGFLSFLCWWSVSFYKYSIA